MTYKGYTHTYIKNSHYFHHSHHPLIPFPLPLKSFFPISLISFNMFLCDPLNLLIILVVLMIIVVVIYYSSGNLLLTTPLTMTFVSPATINCTQALTEGWGLRNPFHMMGFWQIQSYAGYHSCSEFLNLTGMSYPEDFLQNCLSCFLHFLPPAVLQCSLSLEVGCWHRCLV